MSMVVWEYLAGKSIGPLQFGMQRDLVFSALTAEGMISGDDDTQLQNSGVLALDYEGDRLVEVELDLSKIDVQLSDICSADHDCLQLALTLTDHCQNARQSQGGSLHFNEIGVSVLQFESPSMRSIVFREEGRETSEPTRLVSAAEISEYYFDQTLDSLPRWPFGDSPELADRLAALIVAGVKTGTCSARVHNEWSHPGERGVLVDGADTPVAVLETETVTHLRFNEMTQEMAALEGEGDLSLKYWQDAHKAYFTREGTFAEDMEVVFETFRVLSILDDDFAAGAADHLRRERAGETV